MSSPLSRYRELPRRRQFLIRLVFATIGLVLLGVLWNYWWPLALLPAFLFFLWLRIRRGAAQGG
jgi:hypothetical protein